MLFVYYVNAVATIGCFVNGAYASTHGNSGLTFVSLLVMIPFGISAYIALCISEDMQ